MLCSVKLIYEKYITKFNKIILYTKNLFFQPYYFYIPTRCAGVTRGFLLITSFSGFVTKAFWLGELLFALLLELKSIVKAMNTITKKIPDNTIRSLGKYLLAPPPLFIPGALKSSAMAIRFNQYIVLKIVLIEYFGPNCFLTRKGRAYS